MTVPELESPQYPLYPGQLSFWPLQTFWNIAFRILVKPSVSTEQLSDACKALMVRYDVITTPIDSQHPKTGDRYIPSNGPSNDPLTIPQNDSSAIPSNITIPIVHHSAEDTEPTLQEQFGVFMNCTFDRTRDLLMQLEIHQKSDRTQELWVVIDHIAADASSIYIFFKDLDALLSGEFLSQSVPYYKLPSQTTQQTNSATSDQDIQFWSHYLQSPPLLKVPIVPAEAMRGRVEVPISESLLATLKNQFPNPETLEAALIAATAQAIAQTIDISALLMSIATSNRTLKTVRVFGFFAERNVIILRQIAGKFSDVLGTVQDELAQTKPHQQAPSPVKDWLITRALIGKPWQWLVSGAIALFKRRQPYRYLDPYLNTVLSELPVYSALSQWFTIGRYKRIDIMVNILPLFLISQKIPLDHISYVPDAALGHWPAQENRLLCWFSRNRQNEPMLLLEGGLDRATRQTLATKIVDILATFEQP